jgi:hypothetical protein
MGTSRIVIKTVGSGNGRHINIGFCQIMYSSNPPVFRISVLDPRA